MQMFEGARGSDSINCEFISLMSVASGFGIHTYKENIEDLELNG